jgi:hypothetical protein
MDTCQHRPVKTKDVRILVRPQSNSAPLEQVGAQLVSGDLKDPLSLERASRVRTGLSPQPIRLCGAGTTLLRRSIARAIGV